MPLLVKQAGDLTMAHGVERANERMAAPIRASGHDELLRGHGAGDLVAMVDDILDRIRFNVSHADLVAAIADADRVQTERGEPAERRGPLEDVDAAHVARVAVRRRPDTLDEDDRVERTLTPQAVTGFDGFNLRRARFNKRARMLQAGHFAGRVHLDDRTRLADRTRYNEWL